MQKNLVTLFPSMPKVGSKNAPLAFSLFREELLKHVIVRTDLQPLGCDCIKNVPLHMWNIYTLAPS